MRYKVTVDGKRIFRSHYVWNLNNPDNPIIRGDGNVIHHKDNNQENDAIENLEKMSDFEHRGMETRNAGSLKKWQINNPEKSKEICRNNLKRFKEDVKNNPEKYQEIKLKKQKLCVDRNKTPEMIQAVKASWENSDRKRIASEATKKRWEDPEFRKKVSNKHKERWENNCNRPLYNFHGDLLNLHQIAEKSGIPYRFLRNRLGIMRWTVEEATTTPIGERRKK